MHVEKVSHYKLIKWQVAICVHVIAQPSAGCLCLSPRNCVCILHIFFCSSSKVGSWFPVFNQTVTKCCETHGATSMKLLFTDL